MKDHKKEKNSLKHQNGQYHKSIADYKKHLLSQIKRFCPKINNLENRLNEFEKLEERLLVRKYCALKYIENFLPQPESEIELNSDNHAKLSAFSFLLNNTETSSQCLELFNVQTGNVGMNFFEVAFVFITKPQHSKDFLNQIRFIATENEVMHPTYFEFYNQLSNELCNQQTSQFLDKLSNSETTINLRDELTPEKSLALGLLLQQKGKYEIGKKNFYELENPKDLDQKLFVKVDSCIYPLYRENPEENPEELPITWKTKGNKFVEGQNSQGGVYFGKIK